MSSNEVDLRPYLACTAVVDCDAPAIQRLAKRLAAATVEETARRCFEYVRDEVAHSLDINGEELSCAASEVLRRGHGYCYAKSHLLVALLRANHIPAGFDYQRLDDDAGGFMLHGIATVYLPGHGWLRLDARGNKPGVDARFEPPTERLAWRGDGVGEVNYRLNLAEPLPEVVAALRRPLSVQQLLPLLPRGLG